MKKTNRMLLYFLLILLSTMNSHAYERRLRVPNYFHCERNYVTSWTGKVTGYQRDDKTLSLTMFTDADTTENIQFHFNSPNELLTRLYLKGKAFTADSWQQIESAHGLLKDNMKLTVWLCADNNTQAIINWQPGNNLK